MKTKLIPTIMVMLFLASSGAALAYASISYGWVTGAGSIGCGDERDSFSGYAFTKKDGSVQGRWLHIDHGPGQNTFEGKVDWIIVWDLNGPEVPEAVPNKAMLGGEGKFNGVPGYVFMVSVEVFDHPEEGIFRDRYSIVIYNGGTVFEADDILSGGNIQIHPPNEGHPPF